MQIPLAPKIGLINTPRVWIFVAFMIVFQLFLIYPAGCGSLILFLVLLAERQLKMCCVSAEWIFDMYLNFGLTHVLFYAKNTETRVPHLFRDCQWYQKTCILVSVKRGESSPQCYSAGDALLRQL